jgi:LacI family transcriptional regulator
VPQHLSLIGFDDIPISRYTDPQLTTVRYPIMSMAKLATELALQGAAEAGSRGQPLLYADAGAPTFGGAAANCGADH